MVSAPHQHISSCYPTTITKKLYIFFITQTVKMTVLFHVTFDDEGEVSSTLYSINDDDTADFVTDLCYCGGFDVERTSNDFVRWLVDRDFNWEPRAKKNKIDASMKKKWEEHLIKWSQNEYVRNEWSQTEPVSVSKFLFLHIRYVQDSDFE